MNPKSPFILFLFCCLSSNMLLNAQVENDSLAKYSYEELHALIDSTKFDKQELSKLYSEEYLRRAKLDNDTIKMARGYFYRSFFEEGLLAVIYIDSTINITKTKNHYLYPALGYYNKGIYLYETGKYNESLNTFFEALKILKKNPNAVIEFDTRKAILSLKSNWGFSEENLNFTKESLKFIIDNKEIFKGDFEIKYFYILSNLSIGYLRLKKYKEGLRVAKQGVLESLSFKDSSFSYDFISLAGTAHYYLKNYKTAIDSLQKALPYEDNHGKAMNNYYLAKSYYKLKQPEKAHFHFLKADSIYQATKDVFPEMRDVYEHIIEYYKSKNDVQNQIKYYDRLIAVDKVIDSTYTYVTETVNKKFDTPQAIAERNRLVEEAKAKESSWKYSFAAISAILLVILGVLVAAFRRQKYYKRRFENIMSIEQSRNALNQTKEKETSKKKDIDVPEEIVESILQQLETFEASQKFTKQISLTELAKKLGTNPKYLSKVINGHYQKNFSTYINELRIEYVISKLKEDSKFRNYTIKAIGKEAGFGNTESFSKAFLKTTGINVSYFINQLQKRLES